MAVSARSASERIILWDKNSHFPINLNNAYCIDALQFFYCFVFSHTVIKKKKKKVFKTFLRLKMFLETKSP